MMYEIFTRDEDGQEFSVLKGTGESIVTVLAFEEEPEDNPGFEVLFESEGEEYWLRGVSESNA